MTSGEARRPSPSRVVGTVIEARDLPERVVVGENGAYWRDYGDSYSMCPVSEDNDPVVPVATYVLQPASEPHPGENHEFRTTCIRCGERGFLHVALIASDERVDISPIRPIADPEPAP